MLSDFLARPSPLPLFAEVMDSLPVEITPPMIDWRLHEAELLSETSGSKMLPRLPIIDIPAALTDPGYLHSHILWVAPSSRSRRLTCHKISGPALTCIRAKISKKSVKTKLTCISTWAPEKCIILNGRRLGWRSCGVLCLCEACAVYLFPRPAYAPAGFPFCETGKQERCAIVECPLFSQTKFYRSAGMCQ